MRSTGLAAIVAALVAADPARSCEATLAAFHDDRALHEKIESFDSALRANLKQLMRAAVTLEESGRSEACEAVAAALRDMAERGSFMTPDARMTARGEVGANEGVAPPAGAPEPPDGATPFDRFANRISTDTFLGADVARAGGDRFGSVEGVLSGPAGISHLIVSHGGFLGIGGREVAAPIAALSYDVEKDLFYLDKPEDWLKRQPDWDQTRWFADPSDWERQDP
jgi:hypothetical protein